MVILLGGLIVIIALFFIMKLTLIIAEVTSQSMSPTLQIGDKVLAFLYWPHKWVKNGHIVIIQPYTDFTDPIGEIPLIKRVIWTKGPLPPYIEKLNFQLGWKQHNKFFLVNGDLSISVNNKDTIGVIPYENFIAIVLIKLPLKKDKTVEVSSFKSVLTFNKHCKTNIKNRHNNPLD